MIAPEVQVRASASPTRAGDWALVLAAAGIPYRLDEREGAFSLVVAAADQEAATAALDGYDAETPARPAPAAPDAGPSSLGVVLGLVFAGMFLMTGAAGPASRWYQGGAADASAILHGQWWRAVTALTLHADILHLVGNVVASVIFGAAVGRWLGAGAGGLAILACAFVANLLTAAARRTDFVSIGASTATFAALGLVVGLQVARRWRGDAPRKYAWVPLGAGLALYAMVGVGDPNTDRYAHLFGLGVGAVVGAALAFKKARAPRALAQAVLAVLTATALAGCWALALR
ncbi:MAG TPA: rhomboid family intramembrane serine protease [Polyangia bacterium]|nr:rhomboid family intramembrane serine protease [Polyangia bacterium]